MKFNGGEGVRNIEQENEWVDMSGGSNQNRDICLCSKQHI